MRSASRKVGDFESSGSAPLALRVRRKGPFGPERQSVKEISSTLYDTVLQTDPGAIAIGYVQPDLAAQQPFNFTSMTPPRTGAGVGANTLSALGVIRTVSQTAATALDPIQRTYLAIKIDHQGFNSCNVTKFNEYCQQFQYCKMSGVMCKITLTDPPLNSKNTQPILQTRPSAITGNMLTQLQQTMLTPGGQVTPNSAAYPFWNETRPLGGWYYIVVPPQRGASINLTEIGTEAGWQRLLNIGYKARPCKGKTYAVMCGTKGFDADGRENIIKKMEQLQTGGGIIPANNSFAGAVAEGRDDCPHQAQECDWCCQYANASDPINPSNTYTSWAVYTRNTQYQGFDVLAYGSAIVFQFCQFAPPTTDTGVSTASKVIIPYQMEVISSTTFSQLKLGSRDVGQLATGPINGP